MMVRLVISGALLAWLVPGWWLVSVRGEEPLPSALTEVDAPIEGEPRPDASSPPSRVPWHEAFAATEPGSEESDAPGEARVPKSPPPPVAERPGSGAGKPGAQWVNGYWAWDKARQDFVWVTGAWRVPPAGKFWVNGYWRRDDQGWYRVPGFWSARVEGSHERRPDWKKDGPPHPPEEDAGSPPGPDHFFVPGIYKLDPKGQGLVWKPGFWYPTQPGWDWVPARWVRRSSGWVFRQGSWQRIDLAADDAGAQPTTTRTSVPPGYPAYNTPQYGYGVPGGSLMGWIGGFLNQVIP